MVVTQIGSSGYEVMETASNNERVRINKMKDGSRINGKILRGGPKQLTQPKAMTP